MRTARVKWEEDEGDGRSVWPESHGLHVAYNGRDNGLQPRKGKLISQTRPKFGLGAETPPMKLESLVIACHHRAVNTSPLLAHTARQVTQAIFW